MKVPLAVLCLATAMLGGIAVVRTACDSKAAAQDARAALDELDRIAGLVEEQQRLQMIAPRTRLGPVASLQSRIAEVLKACQVPSATLTGLTPEAESVVSGHDGRWTAKRRKATLTLHSLTLPQLGAYLVKWRETEPEWVTTSLELSPSGKAPGGEDLPLKVLVALECVELVEQGRAEEKGMPLHRGASPASRLRR